MINNCSLRKNTKRSEVTMVHKIIQSHLGRIVQGVKLLWLIRLFNDLDNTSTTKIKRERERGSPYFKPYKEEKKS